MHNWGYLMRSINNGTFKGSPTAGPLRSGGLLSRDELALPAVCGQTGKPFVMVVRRQGRGMLELIRAVAIDPAPSVSGVPVHLATPTHTPWNFCSGCGHKLEPAGNFCRECGKKLLSHPDAHAAPSGSAGEGMSEDPTVAFQALNVSANVEVGSRYDGCPHCGSRGYFHCSECRLSSCWNKHNQRTHLDHTDIWCAGCRAWKCTSDEAEDDDSLSDLTAYAARESKVALPSRSALGSATREQINRSTSIRGYLKQ
jgi:predicted RNA-binding Zn-ribbon protein involved in translation (DUF1610 family)